jgi:hypothetical protein
MEKQAVLSRMDVQGRAFLYAKIPAQERVNAFQAMDNEARSRSLERMGLTEKTFREFSGERQAKELARAEVELQARFFERMSLERQIAAMGRVNAQMGARDIQMQRQILARTTPSERVNFFRTAPDNERGDAFGRAFKAQM